MSSLQSKEVHVLYLFITSNHSKPFERSMVP
jgi:hypothetical protein